MGFESGRRMDKWERITTQAKTTWLTYEILDMFQKYHSKHIKVNQTFGCDTLGNEGPLIKFSQVISFPISLGKDLGEWVEFKANGTTRSTHLSCSIVSTAKKETPKRLCVKNKDSHLDLVTGDTSLINFLRTSLLSTNSEVFLPKWWLWEGCFQTPG